MNELRSSLYEYLAMRRALGFKLREEGRLLPRFLDFMEQEGGAFITTESAMRWATQPSHVTQAHQAARLRMARLFAKYRLATDPRTEVPPQGLLPYRYQRKQPYIYTADDISHLLAAAKRLSSATGLRAATYSTLFGLMVVTGMRISEPIALRLEDVDLGRGILTVRNSKFGKSRLIPVHLSTVEKLREYENFRKRVFPRQTSPCFFISEQGTSLTPCIVRWTFIKLLREVHLRASSDKHGPRVHDLRHAFAVRTLLNWYRTGVDVEQHLPELAAYLGHRHVNDTYWYISAVPELLRLATERLQERDGGGGTAMKIIATLPALLESFFTERLMQQRRASPETIASYRDAFCLLLGFAQKHLHKAPSTLGIEDLDVPFVSAFLKHLENERKNSSRTRNARLAAIHSLFKYAALREPVHSAVIQRVLAIPGNKCDRTSIDYLTRTEAEAILSVPDPTTWSGRRDKALLLLAVQTGLRVSELIGLSCQDVALGSGAHVRCKGKGRKERCTPLRKETVNVLRGWLRELNGDSSSPLFPNARGQRLSRDGVDYLLRKHLKKACHKCPSLQSKRVSPHVLRHTAAMELLQNGVDRSVIALWLGHETLETVQVYVHANLQLKEKALAKTTPLQVKAGRFQPGDELMAFLKSL